MPVHTVLILDASEHGLRARTSGPVRVGNEVQVDIGEASLLGTARYCREIDEGVYNVGLSVSRGEDTPGGGIVGALKV